MQEIFNFVKNNWQLIVGVLTFIASVIVAIVRKRPVDSIITAIFCAACQAISVAEGTNYKGREKLNYCVGLIEKSLEVSFPNIKASTYYGHIVKIVEEILTTPQKKER